MLIAILADAQTKAELLRRTIDPSVVLIWPDSVASLVMTEAEAYFDLRFERNPERSHQLKKLFPAPVFISAVADTLATAGDTRFIRINAWPGMLERPILEMACTDEEFAKAGPVFEKLGWKGIRVPDTEGLVTPRMIAMIINEAYFAFADNVSSKDQIDLAMKLGTGYPYGPFEWAQKIGLTSILQLLRALNAKNQRYEIAPALIVEAEDINSVNASNSSAK